MHAIEFNYMTHLNANMALYLALNDDTAKKVAPNGHNLLIISINRELPPPPI